jgi:prevent-host-death family protein
MKSVSATELRAHLRDLLDHAAAVETIQILRRGRPVAQLTPVLTPRKPIDIRMLRCLTNSMPLQTESAGDFIRDMRDSDRY